MAGLRSFGSIGNAFDLGKVHYQYVTKATTPTPSTATAFVDMNQSSGHPKYNAFAGTQQAFNSLVGGGNAGVYVGPAPASGEKKWLARWTGVNINTSANTLPPDIVHLCDYLGFYPLLDGDDVDLQVLDNTDSLQRYADGDGVRIVLVTQAPLALTASMTVNYTSCDDSAKSVTTNLFPGVNLGVCCTTSGASGAIGTVTPFLPLAAGCRGVKKIDSIQLAGAAGGFFCACLVKPIDMLQLYESGVASEKQYGFDRTPPEIKDGAYLNFLIQRSGTSAGSFRAELVFINS